LRERGAETVAGIPGWAKEMVGEGEKWKSDVRQQKKKRKSDNQLVGIETANLAGWGGEIRNNDSCQGGGGGWGKNSQKPGRS